MTGRDIVKAIVKYNLLDKSISSPSSSNILEFCDYLPSDDAIIYQILDNGTARIILTENFDKYILQVDNFKYSTIDELKSLDSYNRYNEVISDYNQYICTFTQWLKTCVDPSMLLRPIVDYFASDSNLSKNCSTFNKLMSYLEAKSVDEACMLSAEAAWTQYMRECRKF